MLVYHKGSYLIDRRMKEHIDSRFWVIRTERLSDSDEDTMISAALEVERAIRSIVFSGYINMERTFLLLKNVIVYLFWNMKQFEKKFEFRALVIRLGLKRFVSETDEIGLWKSVFYPFLLSHVKFQHRVQLVRIIKRL